MKRTIVFLLVMLTTAATLFAVPAMKGKFRYRQPDGTILVLERHGDEFENWTTDESGNILEQGSDGFYRRTSVKKRTPGLSRPGMNQARWSSYETAPSTNFGERSILCILIEFADSVFVLDNPKQRFSNMLNQEGYSYNGATGSVRDYYIENSHGLFKPSFDVYGPVRLENPCSTYGNTDNGSRALREACALLDGQIDFSQYDSDQDGKVDMILFYYAGHNEAEGAGTESIWPHSSTAYGTFDEVSLSTYFCTSELRLYKGTEMCGIGTTCHEFGHSLGLPDFYDTDYEKSGGENEIPVEYMLMASGGYLNDGRTPPYMTSIERNMLGWMPNHELIDSPGQYTILPVQQDDGRWHPSFVEGEYFVYEYRNGEGWDTYLPTTGMMVYHIDKSERIVSGDYTAAYLWEYTNKFNAFYGHPCLDVVRSSGNEVTFPGSANVTYFSPLDWDGNPTTHIIKDIACDGERLSFTLERPGSDRAIWGLVTDIKGQPIEGASVRLSLSLYEGESKYMAPGKTTLSTDFETVTDQKGAYMLEVPQDWPDEFVLYASAEGYITQGMYCIPDGPSYQDFALLRIGDPDYEGFHYFSPLMESYRYGFTIDAAAVGMRLTPEVSAQMGYDGGVLENIRFRASAYEGEFEKVYAVVYLESELVAAVDVSSMYKYGVEMNVDLSDKHIALPADKDLYIGYAFTGIVSGSHPFFVSGRYEENNGGGYRSRFSLDEEANWLEFKRGEIFFYPFVAIDVAVPRETSLSDMGVAWLDAGDEESFPSGKSFIPTLRSAAGKPVGQVKWYYDGEEVPEEPVILYEGQHTWMAEIFYLDGTTEKVWLDIDVD